MFEAAKPQPSASSNTDQALRMAMEKRFARAIVATGYRILLRRLYIDSDETISREATEFIFQEADAFEAAAKRLLEVTK